jgi:hypothetical protein
MVVFRLGVHLFGLARSAQIFPDHPWASVFGLGTGGFIYLLNWRLFLKLSRRRFDI